MRAMKHWNSSHSAVVDAPNTGDIHGQAGRSCEPPDLVENVSSYCRGIRTR